MSEPVESTNNTNQNATPTPGAEPETTAEKTFTQAEMEAIIGKRVAKATKGMPKEEELSAFRAWKESQQTEKERWDALTKERDESKTALEAAQAELEQLRREKQLLSLGVPVEDVDYYAFKIGKLAGEDLPFEKAAEKYLKEHAAKSEQPAAGKMTVDFSAPLSGGKTALSLNDRINNKLRGV